MVEGSMYIIGDRMPIDSATSFSSSMSAFAIMGLSGQRLGFESEDRREIHDRDIVK
jgi:hypothetical protein